MILELAVLQKVGSSDLADFRNRELLLGVGRLLGVGLHGMVMIQPLC